jgi:hypothetical protein
MVIRRKDDSIQPVEGIVRNVSAERIGFQIDGETVPVSRAKVDGVIYYHAAGRKLPRPLCFVEDVTGQRLAAVGATLAGDHLQLQTVCGLKLRRPLRVLSRLDFSAGKVQFLSDLKHELVRYTPYVGPATQAQIRRRRPRNDCSLDGRTLELRFPEKDDAAEPLAYAKGVSLHSRTLLVYRLPGRYRRFRAVAGIDPAMAGRGHVRLVVAGDDKELLSTVLAGSKDPVTIDVDITGVTRLKILVDFGENRDDADRVHLCDARVIQ